MSSQPGNNGGYGANQGQQSSYGMSGRQDMTYLCAGGRRCHLILRANFRIHAADALPPPADCGHPNEIKPREPIRCRSCGHRIMYKKRTKRSTPVGRVVA